MNTSFFSSSLSFVAATALAFSLAGCSAAATSGNEATASTSDALATINGVRVLNGFSLRNGVRVLNGFAIRNGVRVLNGVELTNGFAIRNGATVTNGMHLVVSDGDMDSWLAEDPTNNLMLIQYVTECALPAGQAVQVDWRGGQYIDNGVMGLGPTWLSADLDVTSQERVSSCLIARVNALGAHVNLDLTNAFDPDMGELNPAMPDAEIAVYGNIFTGEFYGCDLAADENPALDELDATKQRRLCGGDNAYGTPVPAPFEAENGVTVQACGPARVFSRCFDRFTPDSSVCDSAIVDGKKIPTACATPPSSATASFDRTVRPWQNVMVVRYAMKDAGTACAYNFECRSASCGSAGTCQ